MKKKVFVFIESDICTRHFVFSGALRSLVEQFDVTFIYPPKDWRRTRLDPEGLPLDAPVRTVDVPVRRVWLWKRLFQVQQLMLRPGADYYERRRCIRGHMHWKQSVQLTVYGLPLLYQLFKASIAWRLKRTPCTSLRSLLDTERPDAVLHPSTFDGYYINDLIVECRRISVPLMLLMNSWDNPSIKQSVTGMPDLSVVWGPQTSEHCRRYMGMPPERLAEIGAAQFDVFKQQPRLNRDAFCAEHGLDPAKRIVLYAGSSKGTDEYSHLDALNAACADGRIAGASILYRPHPWGRCGKDGHRMATATWPHVTIEFSMRDYVQRIAEGDTRMFIEAEYQRTHDVLSNVDAVISPMSTMIIEGALHGKPPLCFLPLDQEQRGSLFETFAGLVHFQEMFERAVFPIAYSQAELIEKTQKLVESAANIDYLRTLDAETRFYVKPTTELYRDALCRLVAGAVGKDLKNALPTDKRRLVNA